MRKPNVSSTSVDLVELQKEINQKLLEIEKHERECKMNSDRAFEAKIMAGELLTKCRRELGYGRFGEWIKKNTRVSPKTAACYMALAERWKVALKLREKWPFLTTTILYEFVTGVAKKAEEILVVGDEKFVITREVIQKAKKRFNEECKVAKAAGKPEPKTMVIDAKADESATPSVAPQAGAKTQISSSLPTVPERPADGFTAVWLSKEDYATLISLRKHPEEPIQSVLSRVIREHKSQTPTSVATSTSRLVVKEIGCGKTPSPTSTATPASVQKIWKVKVPRNVNIPRRVLIPCPPAAGMSLSSVALRSVVTELRKKEHPCSLSGYVTGKPLPASSPQLPGMTAPSVPLHGNVSPNMKKISKAEQAKVKKLVKISMQAGAPCEVTMSNGEKVTYNGGVTPQTYEQLDMFDEDSRVGGALVRPKPRKRTAGNKQVPPNNQNDDLFE